MSCYIRFLFLCSRIGPLNKNSFLDVSENYSPAEYITDSS